jgi:hypothetical protein
LRYEKWWDLDELLEANSVQDLINIMENSIALLKIYEADGIKLDVKCCDLDHLLYTENSQVAQKHGFDQADGEDEKDGSGLYH